MPQGQNRNHRSILQLLYFLRTTKTKKKKKNACVAVQIMKLNQDKMAHSSIELYSSSGQRALESKCYKVHKLNLCQRKGLVFHEKDDKACYRWFGRKDK